MTNIFRARAVLVVLVFAACSAAAQVTTPAPSEQDRLFQGTLIDVDTDSKTIIAKGADNTEMIFHYTGETEIIGAESTARGLVGKAGSELIVTYNVDRGVNIATRIELLPQ